MSRLRLLGGTVYTIAVTGARVLVVEDDRDSAELLARYLTARGAAVTRAGSAEEAERLLAAGAFDLVLLDAILPGKTGLQALGALTKLTRAPIWLMSGQSAEDVEPDARLLGAAGFLRKPLELEAVAALAAALPPG